jgi:integrase
MSNRDLNLFPPTRSGYLKPFLNKGYKGRFDIYYWNAKTGKRTKKATKIRNLEEATRELIKFKRTYFSSQRDVCVKLISDLKDVLLERMKVDISKRTVEIHENSIGKLMSVIGNKRIDMISGWDIEDFKAACLKARLSPTSVNIYFRSLRRLFNKLKQMGVIDLSPLQGVRQIPIPESERPSFEPDEVRRLLQEIESPMIKQIVLFALLTGCRRGEIMNLTWDDIDLSRMVIKIRNKVDFQTKTRREREIPISNEMLNFMREMATFEYSEPNLFNNIYEIDTKQELRLPQGRRDKAI